MVRIGCRHVHPAREDDRAAADVGVGRERDAGFQPSIGGKAIQPRVAVRNRQREASTHRPRPREWVERLAVTSAEHRLVVDTVRCTEPRSKERFADLKTEIHRIPTHAAEPNRVRRDVEPLDAAALPLHQRVVLVADA